MKAALLIARRDLAAYFSTLSGFLILGGHLLLTGLLFNAYAVGAQPKLSQQVLEDYFYYASGMAMVTGVLLAMRLIAEERQMQTLVLLRTAPLSERQIVWGKFLSALGFFTIALAASLYLPALIFIHGKVSVLQIATGYLGLFLLGGACIALTLLASAWCGTQTLAGAIGGLMVTLLLILWLAARVTDEPLKALLDYLALHNQHFRPFGRGVVHVKDILYYVGLTALALECAVVSLAAWRWRE
ncbi:MAG: ABC transporter permease [SAR324 cluster bacterium]